MKDNHLLTPKEQVKQRFHKSQGVVCQLKKHQLQLMQLKFFFRPHKIKLAQSQVRRLNICEQLHKRLLRQSAHQTNKQKISSKTKAKRFLRHQKKLLTKQKRFYKQLDRKSQLLLEKLLRKRKNLFRKLKWHSSDHKKKPRPTFKIMNS